ncbi:DUF2690 domain-containing protein [Streptomyces jumonjinensis]|uniref:DUF2690 domain-containing protein n=2 Tax=Streptomyces jumonjinensis TaxID=1945 RepID=UPI0037B73B0E
MRESSSHENDDERGDAERRTGSGAPSPGESVAANQGRAPDPDERPPDPDDRVPASGRRGWIRRHGPETLIGAMIVAVVAALVPVALTALIQEESSSTSGKPPPAKSSAAATPDCKGETCHGLDPEKAGCTQGTITLRDDWAGLMRLEIRYNPACETVWAKLTGAGPGDTVSISTSPGKQHTTEVDWGKTKYTPMLHAPRKNFSAQATAVAVKGYPAHEIPKGYELRIGANATHLPTPTATARQS